MALFPLGILSAAGAGGAVGDYELIETSIISGSSTSAITFSNLGNYSSTYKHLQIRAAARTNRTSFSSDFVTLRFNGDTASNYSHHTLNGNGSAVVSEAYTNATAISFERFGAGSDGNYFGGAVVDILDSYSTTKNKTVRAFGGASGTGLFVNFNSGAWRNTASVTSITLTVGGGTILVAGSRFSLYGIRG